MAATNAKTKFQTFEMVEMLRSKIVEHPRNPRQISDGAKSKLKKKLKDVGLMQPLVVNKRTGYLLSGHQRMANLDSLEHYKPGNPPVHDYLMDVSVVDVDETIELEMLAFFNNASAQGSWDLDQLATMALDGLAKFGEMGFERKDIELLFDGDSRFDTLFADDIATAQTKEALKSMKQDGREASAAKKGTGLDEFRARGASRDVNADYYVTVVCKDAAEKETLMKHLRIPKGEEFIAPAEILSLKRG